MRDRRGAVLLLGVMLVSCRTWTAAPTAVTPHESLDAVLWTRTSGEYIVLTEQAYRLARMQVDEALKPENATWTAALEQVQGYEDLPPAVVLDVDEAVLDTGSFQAQLLSTGERFGPTVWDAWVHQHKGEAIPGAVEFARYAVANGVSLFFVTNRDWELEEATRENLQDLGFPVEADGANLLTKGERPEWEVDKTSRRKFVAESHRVILMIGDDLNDFFSGSQTDPRGRMALARRWKSYWGTRWIMLPNPFYGGWERSLYDFDEDLTRQQILRRKFDALEAPDTPPAVETPGLPHPDQPGT